MAPAVPLRRTGGEGGIRTLEGLTPLTVFETARFSRSRTSPRVLLHEVTEENQAPRRALATDPATDCGPEDPFRADPKPACDAVPRCSRQSRSGQGRSRRRALCRRKSAHRSSPATSLHSPTPPSPTARPPAAPCHRRSSRTAASSRWTNGRASVAAPNGVLTTQSRRRRRRRRS